MDRSHASHGAVWSQRLRSFIFKPLIKSESFKFHIKLTARLTRRPWRVAVEALVGIRLISVNLFQSTPRQVGNLLHLNRHI